MEKEGTITQCFGCPYYRTPSDDKVKIDGDKVIVGND